MLAALRLHSLLIATDQTGYPPITTQKDLYAAKDLRGKPAPKLTISEWLTGNAPDTRGKTVILNFWKTSCKSCRQTIPVLNEFAREFNGQAVIIGVTDESPDAVRSFMATTPMNYNVAIDRLDRMTREIGVKDIPHVLVISPDGIVRWQGFPLDEKDELTDTTISQIIAASKR